MTTGMNLWDGEVWSFVLTLSLLFTAMIAATILRNTFSFILCIKGIPQIPACFQRTAELQGIIFRNKKGMFMIEELERVALMRCDNARDAIQLIGKLVKEYGYGDGGECITIADKNEVWQMEILGEGPDKIGGVWAAKRIPDDEVGVSANIARIGKLERKSKDFYCSDNCEAVAKKYGLWDGQGDFIFWKAFRASYSRTRTPWARRNMAVPTVASMSKPMLTNRRTRGRASSLSSSARVTTTVPWAGRRMPEAIRAL